MPESQPPAESGDSAASPATPRKRRTWPKIVIPIAVLLVAALVAGGFYVYSIDRSVTRNITRSTESALPVETPTASGMKPRPTKQPNATGTLNYVLLGADGKDPDASGEGRSDTIIVVHLNAARNRAYVISFPRDMWVSIPGRGRNKINAAYAFGGAPLTVSTLESLLDARMDHVVLIDFEGFIKLTETLGGVTVENKTAFRSHGFTYPKGTITVKGEQALWFVRERKQLPNGDLDRAENQRNVIKAVVQKGLSPEVIRDPRTFTAFVGGVARYLTVDQTLTDGEIRSTALSLRLSGKDIELLQAPIKGFGTSPDGQSIDVVDAKKLAELGKAIRENDMAAYVKKYPEG